MERLHLVSDRPATIRPAAVVALAVLAGAAMALLAVAGPSRAAGHTVQAQDYAFVAPDGGSALTVTVGDQVTWEASGDPHTVTSGAPGAIDQRFTDHSASVGFLTSGSTFTTTFSTAGTYPYFCEVHPEQMRGVINVVALVTTPPTAAPPPTPAPAPTKRPTPQPTALPPTAPPPASPTTPGTSSAGSPTPTSSAAESGSPSAIGTQTPPPNGAATAGGSADGAGGAGWAPILIAIVLLIAALSLGAALLGRRRRSSG